MRRPLTALGLIAALIAVFVTAAQKPHHATKSAVAFADFSPLVGHTVLVLAPLRGRQAQLKIGPAWCRLVWSKTEGDAACTAAVSSALPPSVALRARQQLLARAPGLRGHCEPALTGRVGPTRLVDIYCLGPGWESAGSP